MHACCLLDNEANEENYDELRKAVQENWVTMKEYFKAVSLVIHYDPACTQQLSHFLMSMSLYCAISYVFCFSFLKDVRLYFAAGLTMCNYL